MDRILWHLCMITSFLWAWHFGDESWDNLGCWWIRQSSWRSVLSECEWQKGNEVSIFQTCQQTAGMEITQWTPTSRPLRRMGRRRSRRRCWTWQRRSRGRGLLGRRLASRPPCRCRSTRWTFDFVDCLRDFHLSSWCSADGSASSRLVAISTGKCCCSYWTSKSACSGSNVMRMVVIVWRRRRMVISIPVMNPVIRFNNHSAFYWLRPSYSYSYLVAQGGFSSLDVTAIQRALRQQQQVWEWVLW